MFAWTSHGTELKRFTRLPITRAAVAVMLLIPLLYGAMYVWAFWDPTTRMNDLPVALVNQDQPGTDSDGKSVTFGRDVVDQLVEDDSIGWVLLDQAEAVAGMDAGRYYFTVTIPEDFSARITSLGEAHPKAASIQVTYDDSNSFLASTLGRSAMLEVRDAVAEKVSKEAVRTLLVGVGDARDGFAAASDGAFELSDGLEAASDGADRLNVGAADLAAGAAKLADGTDDLAAGARTLAGKLGDYVQGISDASAGVQQLRTGAAGLTALQTGLAQAADPTTGAPALAAGVKTLVGGATSLADGATAYAEGANSFATGAGTWVVGAEQWRQAVATATGGQLARGTEDRATGAKQLAAATASGAQLAQGADAVAAGTTTLAVGLGHLDDSLAEAQSALDEGDTATAAAIISGARSKLQGAHGSASELADGAAKVSAGLAGVHSGAAELATGAATLNAGYAQLSGAVADGGAVATGLTRLDAGQRALGTAAGQLDAGAEQLADPATLASARQLSQGATSLATALQTMSAGASDPAAGIPALQAGLATLDSGFTDADPEQGLVSGARALHTGARTLASGLDTASEGATRLSDGSGEIAANTPALASGLADAHSGANELGSKLAGGADQLPDDSAALLQSRASAIATPVTTVTGHVHEADSWGEGFAPFFISLALWVGALITWLLLRPLQTRALMTSVNGFRMAWGSLNSALLLSLGQVVIMLTVMHVAIGLDPANMLATFAFTMLAAAAFFALQQFFQVTLGSAVGKVVIIVLLMVQLASAGGTYPIQTTPSFLQAISPYLPMTYVVTGLREAITGGIETRFWSSVVVLAAIFVVSLAATSLASARKRIWTMSRLHPALSI